MIFISGVVHWKMDIIEVFADFFPFTNSTADDEQDIIDEALYYFKANVFFKSFEVKVNKQTY